MLRSCRMRVEQLLETEWSACYRLALALVGEPAAAEDVTQEALLAAFEGREGFDEARPVRPWLFGIVHRRALKHHRARRRRAAREERVARPERTDDATSKVDDADEAALVRQHLAGIRAEYRHALALRYLEGLSLAEVGEALGIPLGTVSSQVRRGLRDLERSLSPVLSVGGSALLELLQRALREASVPAPPTAHALIRRGLRAPEAEARAAAGAAAAPAAQRRWARAAGALLAAGAIVAALLRPISPTSSAGAAPSPTGGRPAVPSQRRLATTDPPRADAYDRSAAVAPARSAVVAAAKPSVSGRVRGAVALEQAWVQPIDGQELARLLGPLLGGADVDRARRLLGRERFGWNVPQGSIPVAADGAFTVELPPRPTLLALGAQGCRTRLLALEAATTGRASAPLDVELVWLHPARLSLVAVDQGGLPYGGAWVRLSGSLEADPWVDGLDAWAAGRPDGARLLRTLRGDPLERVALDPDGAAALTLPAGDWSLEAQLLAGTREPSSVAPYQSGSLPPVARTVRLPPGGVGDLRLAFDWTQCAYGDHRARLDVEVVDGAGSPVAGAWVQVLEDVARGDVAGLRAVGQPGPSWVTDARGRARLVGLAELRELAVAARAGARWTGPGVRLRTTGAWSSGEPVPLVRLALDRPWDAGAARLRLRDAATGEPATSPALASAGASTVSIVAAWDVRLRALSGQPEVGQSGWREEADGALLVDDLPPGRWEVLVEQPAALRASSWLPARIEVEVAAGTTREVALELARGATLRGRVTLDGAPAASTSGADVALIDEETDRRVGQASLDADGRFAIAALPAGRSFTLLIGARPGGLPALFRGVVPDGAEQPFALPTEPGLMVRVVDELGGPLRGAEVSWRFDREEGRGETDEAGEVVFRGPLVGPLAVRVCLQGYAPQELAAKPPGPARLQVQLVPAAGSVLLRGRVVDPGGLPLRGVAVGAGSTTRAVTDAEGRFQLRLGGATSAHLFLELAGYLGGGHRVDLPAEGGEAQLTLAPGATVEGRVVAPTARLARLRVRAVPATGEDDPRLDLDPDGAFRSRRALRPGSWRLEVVDRDSGAVLLTHHVALVGGLPVRDLLLIVD